MKLEVKNLEKTGQKVNYTATNLKGSFINSGSIGEWEKYFNKDSSFYINSVCFGKVFTHSLYVSQRVKDGIVDRFRKSKGSRPTVDKFNPDVYIDVHIDKNFCTFSTSPFPPLGTITSMYELIFDNK